MFGRHMGSPPHHFKAILITILLPTSRDSVWHVILGRPVQENCARIWQHDPVMHYLRAMRTVREAFLPHLHSTMHMHATFVSSMDVDLHLSSRDSLGPVKWLYMYLNNCNASHCNQTSIN